MSELAVLVPVHDEAQTLGAVLDRLQRSLPRAAELIVIDDGSTDLSARIAEARGVRVIRHDHLRGYGAALRSGLEATRARALAIIDADGTYAAEDLAHLLERWSPGSMIIGARSSEPNTVRRLIKRFFHFFVRLHSGRSLPDLNSGLRVFDRRIAERLAPVLPARFSFTTTLTLGALALGAHVEFLPVAFGPRKGRSKFRAYDVLAFARTVLRGCAWLRDRRTLPEAR